MTASVALVEEPAATTTTFEFDEAFQTKIVALALRDTDFAMRTDGLLRPEYMSRAADSALIDIAGRYYARFRKAPDKVTLGVLLKEAVTAKRIRKDLLDEVKEAVRRAYSADISDREFVVEQIATFARERAVEEAMIKAVGHLERREFAKIEKDMRAALDVGVAEDAGEYDYFECIGARTEERVAIISGKTTRRGITTGVPELDAALYHNGWGFKELSLLMGPAKAGKSMGLADFAQAASLAGHPTLITTLEVAAEIYADRLDANLTETAMRALKDRPHEVRRKIEELKAKSGLLKIREFPSGTMKPSQLRRLLERYRARGIKFDLVVVDYADIMAPEYATDSAIENSKSIYLALRAIAQEYDCAVLSATQTNREGAKKMTASMTDVAEDFNKVRIADIVISINASEEEKRTGEARLFFAASRNTEDGFTLRIKQDREKMKFIKRVLGRE